MRRQQHAPPTSLGGFHDVARGNQAVRAVAGQHFVGNMQFRRVIDARQRRNTVRVQPRHHRADIELAGVEHHRPHRQAPVAFQAQAQLDDQVLAQLWQQIRRNRRGRAPMLVVEPAAGQVQAPVDGCAEFRRQGPDRGRLLHIHHPARGGQEAPLDAHRMLARLLDRHRVHHQRLDLLPAEQVLGKREANRGPVPVRGADEMVQALIGDGAVERSGDIAHRFTTG
nr:hypothetical protein [Nocardia brasiliensis]